MNLEVTSLFDLAHTSSRRLPLDFSLPWEALEGI